ncbi:MAG: D-tyrosyl-tRNA(Tyr) deacylase [Bacteroidales bacterium]|jgi:D-tyrosyl-tRNA(Tyr) deacylase|nr:D-tyrosyl-tRNA(Tyr) deacylase [Bacteroidales bacterium]
MRAVIQRVRNADVVIDDKQTAKIGYGLLVLVSVEEADSKADVEWLSQKVVNMRIFDDKAGVMNLSLLDVAAELLIVSNFTLHASTKKGNRPTYQLAAKREISEPMYEALIAYIANTYSLDVKTGQFGADMKVSLTNDGPVTIIIDSKQRF